MEEANSPNTTRSIRTDEIVHALGQKRDEMQAVAARHRDRVSQVESKLVAQFEQIARELSQAQAEISQTHDQQQQRAEQLAVEAQNVAELKQSLEAAWDQWREMQERSADQQRQMAERIEAKQEALSRAFEELGERQNQVAQAETRLRHAEERVESARTQNEQRENELAELRRMLQTDRHELHTQQERLAMQRMATEDQRRRIAHKLDDRRLAAQRELEQMRAQIEQLATERLTEMSRKLADAEQRNRELIENSGQQDHTLQQRVMQLEASLSEAMAHESQLEDELGVSRDKCGKLETQLAEQPYDSSDEHTEALQSERDALMTRLDEAQDKLADLQRQLDEAHETPVSSEDHEEFQDRYEMAMQDIRDLKAENERLEKQLEQQHAAGATGSVQTSLDWESQKQRMLASLANFDEDDESENDEKLKLESVIETTNVTIASKDQEIAQLRQLLEQQTKQTETEGGEVSVGEVLDHDAVIQQERERLELLQVELQEKLRQAEIEISIERADIARQRVEVEEVMRQFAEQAVPAEQTPPGSESTKPSGRRWLDRLGLKKPDEDE